MNVLDENISGFQRQLLRSWKIPIRQIGYDAGRKGMTDEEIIPFCLAAACALGDVLQVGLNGNG